VTTDTHITPVAPVTAVAPAALAAAIERRLPDAQRFLADLIATPSLSGHEQDAMLRAERAFTDICNVERIPMSNALRDDRDYSDPVPGIEYDGRWNLRAVLGNGHASGGGGGGKRLLLNAHLDTVPPSQNHVDPYVPTVRDGVMFGRGACDDKGQVATAFLAMAALHDLGLPRDGQVVAHLVVEEENGGNGSLAMVRTHETADACIVLEPSDLKLLSSIRGAVWFRINLAGKAGHSGQAGVTRSALKMAVRVMEILDAYHDRLLASSRGLPMFDKFANPMPLTFGKLHAGNWPAAAPSEALLEGVLGLLPNKTAGEVMEEMTAAIRAQGGPDIANNITIHFTYRHDSSVCPVDHPLVRGLADAIGAATHRDAVIDAMTASCDAWFYNNQLSIPTVVFGGGSLSVAHSAHECMPLDQMAQAASALAGFAVQWCR
jgi:acetylornithine deacetylase/succinyl-diaminopimelate desuccinylase-like protein